MRFQTVIMRFRQGRLGVFSGPIRGVALAQFDRCFDLAHELRAQVAGLQPMNLNRMFMDLLCHLFPGLCREDRVAVEACGPTGVAKHPQNQSKLPKYFFSSSCLLNCVSMMPFILASALRCIRKIETPMAMLSRARTASTE